MKIFNTLSRQKEEFIPINPPEIKMFVCGMTVYDQPHIGHARTYIVFDMVAKYFKKRGFDVSYLQNVTDIDDRIIRRAKEAGVNFKEISEKYENQYLTSMSVLGIDSVWKYVRATDNMKEIIAQIQRLIDSGYAYAVPANSQVDLEFHDVYFDISKFSRYGQLSGQNLSEMESGVRKDLEANKRDPRDFALWKALNIKSEPSWKSPWGLGRPGWHIEDTAISEKYFGQQYDLHGGGLDLIFPHHEAEIAQQEASSGKSPFVRYWMHSGWLTVDGVKMSKSLKNFISIDDILTKYTPEAIRMMALSTHYRSPINYTEKLMPQNQAAVNRIYSFIQRLKNVSGDENAELDKIAESTLNKFTLAMDDDFNTSLALGALFEMIKSVNIIINQSAISKKQGKKIIKLLQEFNEVLGIVPQKEYEIPENISILVQKREMARESKNWEESDNIRNEIESLGYKVEDTEYGSLVLTNRLTFDK